jgi:Ca-activated chloride channel homolog
MNRRFAIQTLMAAGAGSFLPRLPAQAPTEPQPTEVQEPQSDQSARNGGDFILRSDVRLVVLDVSVRDTKGGFVSGLVQENFSVTENGRPQAVRIFAHDDVPVTIGIVVDESRSMTPKRSQVLAAAEIFIEESNPKDEVFILHFNDEVKAGLPAGVLFSDDILQLRLALHRGIPEGKTALNDAVVAGLAQLQQGQRDKKALVLISDGGDNASKYTRHEMLSMAERSLATIYTIGLFDPDDPDKDPVILQKLARISGGEAYLPPDLSRMAPVCRRIAKDIRTRYTIGYVPPATGGSLRHIHVGASAPAHGSLAIRTRTSYRYDQLENSQKK